MKTLKLFAIAILTFGAVTAANAQVHVSVSANFGTPVRYYAPPVVVEQPVVYERPIVYHPRTVVVERPVVYHSRAVVYRPRTVVYRDRNVRYRNVKYYNRGHGGYFHQKAHHRHR
jgi:hypothetical protein